MTTATQVQLRRGTQAQNNAFTGAVGELTIDTDNYNIRVHDAVTAGGKVQASKAYVDSQVAGFSANAASNLFHWNTCT